MKPILFETLRNSLQGQVIAHRGAPHLAPENTLSSFKMAAKMNAKWIEFDTQPCASGEWVVIHDATLERTTNGRGKVSELPYSYLKTLEAGSWKSSQFKAEPLPLLSEVLSLLSSLGVHPNIEVKYAQRTDLPLTERKEAKIQALNNFIAILANYWPKNSLSPLISSFDFETLALLKNKNLGYPLGLIVEKVEPNLGAQLKSLEAFSLHCNYENLPTETLQWLLRHMHDNIHVGDNRHRQNETMKQVALLLYTVNEKALAKAYLAAGITAIFSDNPDLYIASLCQSSYCELQR